MYWSPPFVFLGNRWDLNPCWNLLVKSLSRRAEQKKTVDQVEGSGDEKGNKKDKKDYTKRFSLSEIVGKFFLCAKQQLAKDFLEDDFAPFTCCILSISS